MIIGGEPFAERIVMWWNFVGRSHEEIVAHRQAWQAEIGAELGDVVAGQQFGPFPPDQPDPLPAPPLPHVRMKPREQ